jgi:hypothetical protein
MRSVAASTGIPHRFRPAVDSYVAVGAAVLLLVVVNGVASEFFGSNVPVGAFYGLDGLATWVALKVATYGIVGVGGTYLYVRVMDVDVTAGVPGEEGTRLLVDAAAVVAATAALAWVASPVVYVHDFVDRFGRAAGPVFGLGTPAPDLLVGSVVVATRVLVVAPAIAVVAHGLVQSTVSEVTDPAVAVGGTALLVLVLLVPEFARTNPTVAVAFLAAALLAVTGVAGYVHERTGNVVLPAATYGLFVAAMSVAWSVQLRVLHPTTTVPF